MVRFKIDVIVNKYGVIGEYFFYSVFVCVFQQVFVVYLYLWWNIVDEVYVCLYGFVYNLFQFFFLFFYVVGFVVWQLIGVQLIRYFMVDDVGKLIGRNVFYFFQFWVVGQKNYFVIQKVIIVGVGIVVEQGIVGRFEVVGYVVFGQWNVFDVGSCVGGFGKIFG